MLFQIGVAFVASCNATTPQVSDDDTSEQLQPLSCNVGGAGALADACGEAANPVSIDSGSSVTNDSIAYGVHLVPGDGGNVAVLDFVPPLTGTYDIYLGTPHVPMQVFEGSAPVAETPSCDSTIASTECTYLRRVQTFQLVGRASYTLKLGATTVSYVRLYIQLRKDTPPMCEVGELTQQTAACTAAAAGDTRFTAAPRSSTQSAPIALDTVYGVHLTFEEASVYGGAFDFTPTSDGDYELYLGTPNIPLMITGDGAVVIGDCTRLITAGECSQLRRGTRLSLRANVTYRFALGPTGVSYVRVEMRRSASSPLDIKLGPAVQAYTGPASSLAASDLDGDGALDLAVTYDKDPGAFTDILRGSGADSFSLANSYPVASSPWTPSIGEFTGDGIPDVVSISWDGMGPLPPKFLQGQGALTYAASTIVTNLDFDRFVSNADFNEDGRADLVVAYGDGPSSEPAGFAILAGPSFTMLAGDVGFGHDTLQAVAGDFDGDGHQDVVVASASTGDIQLYRGDGTGAITHVTDTTFAGGAIRFVLAVDLDGDGRSDLVVQQDHVINIARGTATGFGEPQTLTFGTTQLARLAVGDFNHDGKLDIVTAAAPDASNNYHAVFLIATGATFVATSPLQALGGAFTTGDFDGDGFVDLAVATGGGVQIYPSTP